MTTESPLRISNDTNDIIFEYWGNSFDSSTSVSFPIDKATFGPSVFANSMEPLSSMMHDSKQASESLDTDDFEIFGRMKISSSAAFFLHNRLGCRVLLEIIQITSKYSDRVINTAMLYDEVSSEYSDIFLNDSDLNGVACSTHINILLAKMVRKKFLERKRKFDDQETSYIATEKGEHALKVLDNLPLKSPHNDKRLRVNVNDVFPSNNLPNLIRGIACSRRTRLVNHTATSTSLLRSISSPPTNSNVVAASSIVLVKNLSHESIDRSGANTDRNSQLYHIRSAISTIHATSSAFAKTTKGLGKCKKEIIDPANYEDRKAGKEIMAYWDEEKTEEITNSRSALSSKRVVEDNIQWDDCSQSDLEIEKYQGSICPTESLWDLLGEKTNMESAEAIAERQIEQYNFSSSKNKNKIAKLILDEKKVKKTEIEEIEKVGNHVKDKKIWKKKLLPPVEKRAPRACTGKSFRYVEKNASTSTETVTGATASSKISRKSSTSKISSQLQHLEVPSLNIATGVSEKFLSQSSASDELLLCKYLDKLTKGTDYPRKFPRVDVALQALVSQETILVEEPLVYDTMWQPRDDQLNNIMYQAFSYNDCRASLFHPGCIVQAYLGAKGATFVCVLGPYNNKSYEDEDLQSLTSHHKVVKKDMLVVFDGEKNLLVHSESCLLPYSDDDIISTIRERNPYPSSDLLLSAHDVALIVGKTINMSIKSQWTLSEVKQYFTSRVSYDNRNGILSKSFEIKSRSSLDVIKLHQFFLPLTATRKIGDNHWGERRMLQLFERAEIILCNSKSIYIVDHYGNMIVSSAQPQDNNECMTLFGTDAALNNEKRIVDLSYGNDDCLLPSLSLSSSSSTAEVIMFGYELLCTSTDYSKNKAIKGFNMQHKQMCLELNDHDQDDDNSDDDRDDESNDDSDNDSEVEEEGKKKEEGMDINIKTERRHIPDQRIGQISSSSDAKKLRLLYTESHQYHSIEQIDPSTGIVVHRYASKREASKAMQGPSPHTILRCCTGQQKISHNFSWKFSSMKELPGWNDNLPSVKVLLAIKNSKTAPKLRINNIQSVNRSRYDIDLYRQKVNPIYRRVRKGVDREYADSEKDSGTSSPDAMDELSIFAEFIDGETDSHDDEKTCLFPRRNPAPFIVQDKGTDIDKSSEFNHSRLNALMDDSSNLCIENFPTGSHIDSQLTRSEITCNALQKLQTSDKVILTDDLLVRNEPPVINSITTAFYDDIESFTGLTYTHIIMITLMRLKKSKLSKIEKSRAQSSTSLGQSSSASSSSSSSCSFSAFRPVPIAFYAGEIITEIFSLFPEIYHRLMRSGKVEDFKDIIRRTLAFGVLVKYIRCCKKIKWTEGKYKLTALGMKKINLLSRVMGFSLDTIASLKEDLCDAIRNPKNLDVGITEVQPAINIECLEYSLSTTLSAPAVASTVTASDINSIDVKKDLSSEILMDVPPSRAYHEGGGWKDVCTLTVEEKESNFFQDQEQEYEVSCTSKGNPEECGGVQEMECTDVDYVRPQTIPVEREDSIMEEESKVIETRTDRYRDSDITRNNDEANRFSENIENKRTILLQTSEHADFVMINAKPEMKDLPDNNTLDGLMAIENRRELTHPGIRLDDVCAQNWLCSQIHEIGSDIST